MGRNGVGKTTLTLDGKDVTNWPPNRRAMGGIGYVPQVREVFPYLTVYENVLMGLEALP